MIEKLLVKIFLSIFFQKFYFSFLNIHELNIKKMNFYDSNIKIKYQRPDSKKNQDQIYIFSRFIMNNKN